MKSSFISKQRQDLQSIFNKAIAAVSPEHAVTSNLHLVNNTLYCGEKRYSLKHKENIYILGAGKGAAPMVVALENILGTRITSGLVCVKYDHSLPTKNVKIIEASHPMPDSNGVLATTKMLTLAQTAGEKDLVICVITGGASALTPAFVDGVTLQDVQTLTSGLLASGATIHEINTVRKHISTFSGGNLARAAFPAQVLSLIVSDVIGDDLSTIASGPTSPDSSTYEDAYSILKKYGLTASSSIKNYLYKGTKGQVRETPKKNNPIFKQVHNVLLSTNTHALLAARQEAESLGYTVQHAPTMEGEARNMAQTLIRVTRNFKGKKPTCFIAGGETTVTLKGNGLGGRNQEMALAASLERKGNERIHCLFAGTDGTDGPTDAAGGFSCPYTLTVMSQKNINGQEYLKNNDAYHFLEKTESLLKTGPTRTNVMDIAIIIAD